MNPDKNARGFSLIELLIVVVVIGIVAAVAIPNLLASRRASNEASALRSLREISTAQATYRSSVGNNNYGAAASLFATRLIDASLAAANNVDVGGNPATNTAKSGFRFRIAFTAAGSGLQPTFVVSGRPARSSGVVHTGTKRFCVTENGMLKSSTALLFIHYDYVQCGFAPAHIP